MDTPIRHPLHHARLERGWSQTDLAREIARVARARGLRSGTDKNRISLWERTTVPSDESQALLAEVFDVPADVVHTLGWPHWLPHRSTPILLGARSAVPALREALKLSMDRRTFTYGGAALAAFAQQWATHDPTDPITGTTGQHVDAELLDWLEATSARLTTLATEQRQHTARLLDAHLETVTTLIAQARYAPPIGHRLHVLAASLAQTIGWHRFDQGAHRAAATYWHAGLHSAHASGDHDLGAGILSDLAYQATWTNEARTAIDILDHAVTRATHPTAKSLLHLRKARAHAALGEAASCRRALAVSEQELDAAASADPSPSWCSWMSEADLAVDSGRCLLDLGQPAGAHRLIGEGLALLPRPRDKTRGVFLSYESETFLSTGDIDQAAHAATQALTLANRIGAPRCTELVRNLAPQFAPHHKVAGVPELLELVRFRR
ncbi:helix-turn-helix domain-containing protein (plasmid) [Embleya sp. NBC_00888]|uniref:helix-turn-helix transcriptional regulator n=1 Tax=Embleya sp. NBC_00888 TaxID=2975960 RepID=UPI002F908110|nr:helix-turn-helix domain-containing protein [Embleya sp. NBC_00888]